MLKSILNVCDLINVCLQSLKMKIPIFVGFQQHRALLEILLRFFAAFVRIYCICLYLLYFPAAQGSVASAPPPTAPPIAPPPAAAAGERSSVIVFAELVTTTTFPARNLCRFSNICTKWGGRHFAILGIAYLRNKHICKHLQALIKSLIENSNKTHACAHNPYDTRSLAQVESIQQWPIVFTLATN